MRRVFLAAFGVPAAAMAIAIVAAVAGSGAQACTSPLPSPTGSVPAQLIPIFQGAAATYDLGPEGAAVLAAINYAESNFDSDEHGVRSGANSAGAAGPMQIGIGGAATDNWDTVAGEIPPSIPGGAEPPSVYNEVDAVYAAAALLERWGAPGNWHAALVAWNDYPPEIVEVTQLAAEYTHDGEGQGGAAEATGAAGAGVGPEPAGGCMPIAGVTIPGSVARILPDGTAAIPMGAPIQVQDAIAAGNRIIDTFYSQERRANMLTQVQDSYDCSGATDFVLYNAGLSSPEVDVGEGVAGASGQLENYGVRGRGQWISVYGSAGHAFIEIAGIVLDTAHYAPVQPASVPDPYPADDPANGGPSSGPRWQPVSIIPGQLNDGNTWSVRHPPGL